jgi:hypothetical protein
MSVAFRLTFVAVTTEIYIAHAAATLYECETSTKQTAKQVAKKKFRLQVKAT